VSVTSAGLTALTQMIYRAMEDGATAHRKLRDTVALSPADPFLIDSARQRANYESAVLDGLVRAWETVTGEIWGEAMRGRRTGS
jgi:hypothetical protein